MAETGKAKRGCLAAMLGGLWAVLTAGGGPPPPAAPAGGVLVRNVGDTIFTRDDAAAIKGILLAEPDDIMGRRFSAGFYPQLREDARYSYHGFARSPEAAGTGYLSGMADARTLRASKEKVQLCVQLPATALGLRACDSEHRYERVTRAASAAGGRSLELSYDGEVGSVVRIGYHERDGGAARDGAIEFDLRGGRMISYKDIRLEIVSADAARISYRVLAPPPPAGN